MTVQGGCANIHRGTITVNGQSTDFRPEEHTWTATNLPLVPGSNLYTAMAVDLFGRSATQSVIFVAQPPEYSYDLNGNLTNDGVLVYLYDEADRLIEARDAGTGEFVMKSSYDGLGRRYERIENLNGSIITNRYVYHHWQVLAVFDGNDNLLESYIHGPDISGHMGGAGGIGGILSVTHHDGTNTATYTYHTDALGNVINVTDEHEEKVAAYTYSPFGKVLTKTGSYDARYQFSSKEFDASTGLNYYGHRFYAPKMARFINRDPVRENGGINLYAFVANQPINETDFLGMGINDPPVSVSGSSECCGGKKYNSEAECCENGKPVPKVPIWICKGRLGGDDSPIPIFGPISHSYVVCQDPSTTADPKRYGKHPKPFVEPGNPFFGPGYINAEKGRNPKKAKCRKEMVCPKEKEGKCSGPGPALAPYCFTGPNCHDWANN